MCIPITVIALLVALRAPPSAPPTVCSAGAQILDEKYGFRNVKFHSAPSDLAGLRPVGQDQFKTKRVRAYVRPTDDLTVFEQKVTNITYFFFDDQLFRIQLDFGGMKTDGTAILMGFATALGCETTGSNGPAGAELSLRASGQHVYLDGVFFVNSTQAFGRVTFEELGLVQEVGAAVKAEATSQF